MWITNAGISVWLFMIPTAEMFKEGESYAWDITICVSRSPKPNIFETTVFKITNSSSC